MATVVAVSSAATSPDQPRRSSDHTFRSPGPTPGISGGNATTAGAIGPGEQENGPAGSGGRGCATGAERSNGTSPGNFPVIEHGELGWFDKRAAVISAMM
ncbi:hypothetical protein [Nocardia asteroides]|uniref:hypothetical protein n=1 Tax=Nocardia asteroides TaxID=1824 RepID=UPI000F82E341|nr:hypothetical protein [Nocardia asteroides]UGT49854.1 hypothetical protein LT345_04420 [Nocardia asteroides]